MRSCLYCGKLDKQKRKKGEVYYCTPECRIEDRKLRYKTASEKAKKLWK